MLNIKIHNVKNIQNLEISLTTEPGVYAITGENGSGKSTLLSCATFTFNHIKNLFAYLGNPCKGAYVHYNYRGVETRLIEKNGKWQEKTSIVSAIKKIFGNPLRGFIEGSVCFGNRFKNVGFVDFDIVTELAMYKKEDAPNFVKQGMGTILHNDEHFYEDLLLARAVNFGNSKRDVYFYEREGVLVDQFHMSTGENLLASVLGALCSKNERQKKEKYPCMIFLDEIEFGLHPSAIKRLVNFFKKIAVENNYAIYFSTHSLAIINEMEDENIYYLQKKENISNRIEIEVVNPCAPAYATNMIYHLRGFDDIIIVEDDKARQLINYILKKENLVQNKLVHCIHVGGWKEVLQRSYEWKSNNVFGNNPKVLAILDKDSEFELSTYLSKHPEYSSIPFSFLPIESIEKFCYVNLYISLNHDFENYMNGTIFHSMTISDVVREYVPNPPLSKKDKNGKNLYCIIERNLVVEGKTEEDLVKCIVDFVSSTQEYNDCKTFLETNL